MKKKLIAVLISLVCCISLCSCTKSFSAKDRVYSELIELGTLYNMTAQKAIDNGWDKSKKMLIEMDSIASEIESFLSEFGVLTVRDGEADGTKEDSDISKDRLGEISDEIKALKNHISDDIVNLVIYKYDEENGE